jgi:hypothetical protein
MLKAEILAADTKLRRCLLKALFDLSFNRFITPSIMSILYVIGLVGVGVGGLIAMFSLFSQGGSMIVVGLVVVPIIMLLYVILLRMSIEFTAAFFRIAQDVRVIAQSGKLPGYPPAQGYAPPSSGPPQPPVVDPKQWEYGQV